jgi:hypothetical protein
MSNQLEAQIPPHRKVVSDSFAELIHRTLPGHGNAKVCKAVTSTFA